MLSIYKKEFGEKYGSVPFVNAEMSTNGSPDTLLPSGITFETIIALWMMVP